MLPGSTVEDAFETQHPDLAKTVRMLNAVFRIEGSGPTALHERPLLTQIGRFTVARCLGSGNFGSVWLANDPVLKRDVAIKVAHIGVHARADLQERFTREAHLAARLHHPNIVPVFETDVDEGRLFIVSEYCEGESLAEWLRGRDEPIEPLMAADLIRQLADAADHAHRQGLIHRDIKPANVMVLLTDDDSGMNPRLTDFGLARDLESETSSTRTGVLLGTTEYMSPEQASGNVRAQGAASDIFSLGVLLYRLLCGTTPFTGQTDFEIIQQIIRIEPISPARRRSSVSRDLSSICMKCLEKDPRRRYATAAHLRDDLERLLRGDPTAARPISTVERIARWAKRSPAAAALVFVSIASVTAIVAGMGVYLRQVERHAEEIAAALDDARHEQKAAHKASDDAEASRLVAESQRERADKERQLARRTSYQSDMRLAFDLWDRGQIHQVREILARQEPVRSAVGGSEATSEEKGHVRPANDVDLRGAEWFALAADFRAKYREIGHHEGGATECVVSRDEARAYSTGVDGVVQVWDIPSGKLLTKFDPNIGEIHALAISPNQSRLAIGGKPWLLDRARVHIVDSSTGERLRTWQTHKTTIESIEFSPDGKWLAAGSRYQPVQLTRLADGAIFELSADRRNRSISFSTDSRFLSIPANETYFVLYQIDGAAPALVREIAGRERSAPYVTAFAPNLPLLANGCPNNNYISLIEPSDPPVLRALATRGRGRGSAFRITCAAFSPDAKLLAAGDDAGGLLAWKPDVGGLIKNDVRWDTSFRRIDPVVYWTPHLSRITSVIATGELTLLTSGEDGRVALTSPFATGGAHLKLRGFQVNDAVLDGNELLLACEDGATRRHTIGDAAGATASSAPNDVVARASQPDVIINGSSRMRCLDLSPDGKVVAMGTDRGGIQLYRRDTGELLSNLVDDKAEVLATDNEVVAVSFSSSGTLLASTGEGFLAVHDITTGKQQHRQQLSNTGLAVGFLANDRFLACGGNFEGIRMLDLDSGSWSKTVTGDDALAVSVGPTGRYFASSHRNGTVQISKTSQGIRPLVIRGHRTAVKSTAFTSAGRTLISLDGHGVLQFTDADTAAVYGKLKLPEHDADSIVCCSDKLLVVLSYGSTSVSDLYFWHLGAARGSELHADAPSRTTEKTAARGYLHLLTESDHH